MKEQIERFIHLISMEYDSGISIVYENHEINENDWIKINVIIEIDNKEYTAQFDNEKTSYNHIDFNDLYNDINYFIRQKLYESRKSL